MQRVVLYDNPGLLEYFFLPARFIMETFILFFLSIFFFLQSQKENKYRTFKNRFIKLVLNQTTFVFVQVFENTIKIVPYIYSSLLRWNIRIGYTTGTTIDPPFMYVKF